jgi:hypothetical protein
MRKDQNRTSGRLESMIKFGAGLVVGVSLSCALASAAQVRRHDGTYWKSLGNRDKTAYVDGYTDAARTDLGKIDQLKLAASLFHWKGADRILAQVARGLDVSGISANDLVAYLDNLYSNSRYGDFDLENAIELAAMKSAAQESVAQAGAPSLPSGSK